MGVTAVKGGKGRGWGQVGSNRPNLDRSPLFGVDNQLHFSGFTPTFALYPQISPSLEPF
jgi:hypothetical protein